MFDATAFQRAVQRVGDSFVDAIDALKGRPSASEDLPGETSPRTSPSQMPGSRQDKALGGVRDPLTIAGVSGASVLLVAFLLYLMWSGAVKWTR